MKTIEGEKQKLKSPVTFCKLKKSFIDSGYEVIIIPREKLENLSKRSSIQRSIGSIMGLILPDEYLIAIAEELGIKERAITLLHEMIHLYDEAMPEELVEETTLAIEKKINNEQLGLLEFLVK